MIDAIAPALTPEEWTQMRHDDGRGFDGRGEVAFDSVSKRCLWVHLSDESGEVYGKDLPALIALANAVLPTDSAYKITRADVMTVTILRRACERIPGMVGADVAKAVGFARMLEAKLAALLPPQENA